MEVFKPATLSLPSRLFNNRPQLHGTCGISHGVYVFLSLNCCILRCPLVNQACLHKPRPSGPGVADGITLSIAK